MGILMIFWLLFRSNNFDEFALDEIDFEVENLPPFRLTKWNYPDTLEAPEPLTLVILGRVKKVYLTDISFKEHIVTMLSTSPNPNRPLLWKVSIISAQIADEISPRLTMGELGIFICPICWYLWYSHLQIGCIMRLIQFDLWFAQFALQPCSSIYRFAQFAQQPCDLLSK